MNSPGNRRYACSIASLVVRCSRQRISFDAAMVAVTWELAARCSATMPLACASTITTTTAMAVPAAMGTRIHMRWR